MRSTMKMTIIALAFVALASAAQAAYVDVVLADNPVGYWRLGELTGSTAINIGTGGAAFDGAYSGNIVLGADGAIAGDLNTAADFSGQGTVTAPHSAALDVQAVTLEAWVNFTSLPASQTLVLGRPVSASPTHVPYRIDVTASGSSRYLRMDIFDGASRNALSTVDLNERLNDWIHVVGTYDGEWIRIYIDGELDNSTRYTLGIPNRTSPFLIGSEINRRYAPAIIDEVAFYNYALSPEQIQAHYVAGIPEPASLLLLASGLAGLYGMRRRRRA